MRRKSAVAMAGRARVRIQFTANFAAKPIVYVCKSASVHPIPKGAAGERTQIAFRVQEKGAGISPLFVHVCGEEFLRELGN